MKTYLARHIGPALAVLFCGVAAWALTLVKWESVRDLVPFAFLVVVLALGLAFGRTVGILGSMVSAAVFAHSLYQPLGSLRIADTGARSGVAWMLLAGVTLSYLLLPSRHDPSSGSQ